MEVSIDRSSITEIKTHRSSYYEIMIAKYINPFPVKYTIWTHRSKINHRIIKQGVILLCIGVRHTNNCLIVMKKFRGIPSAMEFFNDHIDRIKSGNLTIEIKPQKL